jgi:deazaflavin-dependent oxidoreductase (nitroreductase family)
MEPTSRAVPTRGSPEAHPIPTLVEDPSDRPRPARPYALAMPADWQLQMMNGVHRTLLKLTGGRIGWHVAGMSALELTTTGRKSGQPRRVMLTSPAQQGDAIAIVASRGGDDHHPAWFLNLRDNPDVTVAYGGQPRRPMRARVATAEERAELWPKITAKASNYAGYQRKTNREIPVVLLEPIAT